MKIRHRLSLQHGVSERLFLFFDQEAVAEAAPWHLSARATTDVLHTALTETADVASAGRRTMPDIAEVFNEF